MKSKFRRFVAITVLVAVVAGTGTALAAGRSAKAGHDGALVTAVASYLGLTPKQILVDLASGKSLAQVATAQGKTVAGLEQTIEAVAKTDLDKAVAAGKLTGAQEAKILAALPAQLDKLVNAQPLAALKAGLDNAVAAGFLTAAQEQAILTRAAAAILQLASHTK